MIKLENISKAFGPAKALDSINLTIDEGRTTVLIDPSGCGKSTLIRIIIGLIKSDTGSVLIENDMLTTRNVDALRRKMGYVIQDGGLFPHLTARGNVSLMAMHLGWEKQRVTERLAELSRLTKFPLDGLDRFPAQLSGGQNQRVSLMRALMLDPDILLLDEPLGALDPLIRYDLQRDLKEIFQAVGKTVVMVTHDIGEAGFFGDKIVLIKDGSIVQQGTIADLVKTPACAFVSRFINAQRNSIEFVENNEE